MARRSISDLLDRWPFDPHGLGVRIIAGADGRQVLQIRVDLGVLQLELEGRPDGQRPFGYPSLLEFHLDRVEEHRRRHNTIEGFHLTPAECQALRGEAAQVYQRYFGLFHLGLHQPVVRDTARNLRVADLLHRHASTEADRWELEQHRPYITMMNSLARAELYAAEHDHDAAARVLGVGLAMVRAFGAEHAGRFAVTRETEMLTQRLREVEKQRPRSETELLQRQLDDAVGREDYEQAARLRDRLERTTQPDLPTFWE